MNNLKFYILISLLLFGKVSSAQITKAPLKYVDILMIPENNKWEILPNETMLINIYAYAGGIPLDQVELSFEAGNELMPVDTQDKVIFKDGKAVINCGTMKEPGFRSCKINFNYEGSNYNQQIKIGFSPDKIKPSVKLPSDFNAFWEKAVSERKKTPEDIQVIPSPELSTDKVEVSLVKIQNDKPGSYIFAYLSKPKKEGKFPVLLIPPGAGIKRIQPSVSYAENDFITLDIEVHGLSPLADDSTYKKLAEEIGDYIYSNLDNPGNYYYKKVYIGCIRAMDYLLSLPEYDGKNAGVCGGSQGGALTIVTAALDKRITFLASFYPALSDMTGFLSGRAGGWPKIFAPDNLSKISVDIDKAAQTLAYYDVVNFARNITVPGFYSYGYNDNTCPPTSVNAALNVITAPREIVITPLSAHWRFSETNNKSIEWMKKQCIRQ